MLICHCKRVNDRKIREAAHQGARTVAQVGRACGAGTLCGGCVSAVAEIVDSEFSVESTYRSLPTAAE